MSFDTQYPTLLLSTSAQSAFGGRVAVGDGAPAQLRECCFAV
jgi:hypothetical protein